MKRRPERAARAGGYAALATAVVILIAVALNLAVGALPVRHTKIDRSAQSLYALSAQTQKVLSELDAPVTLYLLASAGQEDVALYTLMERYADASEAVRFTQIDPTVNPAFLNEFQDEPLYANSVVVERGAVRRFVSYENIYLYSTTMAFDGERALTAAIRAASGEAESKVYVLAGHGELALTQAFERSVGFENMALSALTLEQGAAVPLDAACVLINAPAGDVREDEARGLIDYLDAGGCVLLTTDLAEPDAMPNLMSVARHMGLDAVRGMIVEGDQNMQLYGYPHYLMPALGDHAITRALTENKGTVLAPVSHGIALIGAPGAVVAPLLTTSDRAYAKTGLDAQTSIEREAGDAEGPFTVGAASEREKGRLVYLASAALTDEGVDLAASGGNTNLMLSALNWACRRADGPVIQPKRLNAAALTMTATQSTAFIVLFVIVIPALPALCGLIIWIRRKRR